MIRKLIIIILLGLNDSSFAVNKECIERTFHMCSLYRTKTPSGWLVYGINKVAYIPDRKHEWEI